MQKNNYTTIEKNIKPSQHRGGFFMNEMGCIGVNLRKIKEEEKMRELQIIRLLKSPPFWGGFRRGHE